MTNTNAGSSNGRTAHFDCANAGSTPAPASNWQPLPSPPVPTPMKEEAL